MNDEFLEFNAAALEESNAFVGSQFKYKGQTYTAIINDTEITTTLDNGGFTEMLATIVLVPLGILPALPKAGETLSTDGHTLRIEKVKCDEVSIELTCVTAAK